LALTKIDKIPRTIIDLKDLKILNCTASKLNDPPETTAKKGLQAIKDYFNSRGGTEEETKDK